VSTRPRETDEFGESREDRKGGTRRIEEERPVESAKRLEAENRERTERAEFRRVTESVIERLRKAEHKPTDREEIRKSTIASFRAAVEESRQPRTVPEPEEKHVESRESGEDRATKQAMAVLRERKEAAEEDRKRGSEARAAFAEAVNAERLAREEENRRRAPEARAVTGLGVRDESRPTKDVEKAEQKKEDTFKAPFRERLTREELDAAGCQHPRLESSVSEQRYTETMKHSNNEGQQTELERHGPKPPLVPDLERQETRRVEHERDIREEELKPRADPEVVRRVLADVTDPEKPEAARLVSVVYKLHGANLGPEMMPVRYADLYQEGANLADDRGRAIARAISESRETVERGLNERLGLEKGSEREVRIAVVDGKLIMWTKETSVDHWENAFAAERFYLKDQQTKAELASEMKRHLGLSEDARVGDRQLREIVTQLSRQTRRGPERFVTGCETPSIKGETLHLAGDVFGRTLKDFLPMIDHVGDRSMVTNLKLPEIHVWRMKLMATALSDCSLAPSGHPKLYQKEKERRDIVIKYLQEFGDFEAKVTATAKPDNGMRRLHMPRVFGTFMEAWGMPVGDKAIHNEGLAPCIRWEALEVKTRYPTQMVAQDGSFDDEEFAVTRANTLHAGKKAQEYEERYGIKPKIGQRDIDFIDMYGEPMSANPRMGYKSGERIRILISTLPELAKSDDPTVAARAGGLYERVRIERNELLDDEVYRILVPLGIEMTIEDTYITHYIASGRVSVERKAHTLHMRDAVRWALLAPPDHPRKMERVVKFIREHPKTVEMVKAKIEADGLHVDPVWEEYNI